MKKLLVLLIVLATASLSQADLIGLQISSLNGVAIDPVGEITIGYSDIVNLDIVYFNGTASILSLDADVVVSGPGSLDTSAGAIAELTFPGGDPSFTKVTVLQDSVSYNTSTANFGGYAAGSIIVDHILVHCDDIGDVFVDLRPSTLNGGTLDVTGSPYQGEWGGVIIHQIPEPMTVALLGLGGLALLRRRR